MDKEDARYQTLEQLHERRKQVVRLHKKGTHVMQIVVLTGLSYPTVRLTIDQGCGQKSILDLGQLEGASQQIGQGMGARAQGSDRAFLPAQLQPAAQP